jgi:S-adenosylmethionine decarboxylase
MEGDPILIGRHLIAELNACKKFPTIDDIAVCLTEAAHSAKAELIKISFHEFDNLGEITAVALLAESHISIHSWPEHGFVACDIFVCGTAKPELALPVLEKCFQAGNVQVTLIERGCYNVS